MMETTITWRDGVKFEATTGSGHQLIMDGAPEAGGENAGARPMELVLVGTGGCTSFDVVHILRKGRHDIRGCVAQLRAERAPTDPKVFTRIHFHFIVSGKDLKPEAVARAIELSATKYCSASIMLAKTADITHDFEVVEVD